MSRTSGLHDLFSSPDFAWSIRMRRDAPEAFFEARDPSGGLLDRRNRWLNRAPELCLALSERGERLVGETRARAVDWGQLDRGCEPELEAIGRNWEADFIFLDSDTFTVAGGCVCFPSSWSLRESTGKTLDEVHGVVPGLNEQIGDRIVRFLERLAPGQAFLRENWGLTRTDHLNYHPDLNRPRIEGRVPLDEVFLRIEHQAFLRLPSGIVLGVRIEPVSLDRVALEAPETARRLAGQLETMPGEVARYKSLEEAVRWVPVAIREAL